MHGGALNQHVEQMRSPYVPISRFMPFSGQMQPLLFLGFIAISLKNFPGGIYHGHRSCTHILPGGICVILALAQALKTAKHRLYIDDASMIRTACVDRDLPICFICELLKSRGTPRGCL